MTITTAACGADPTSNAPRHVCHPARHGDNAEPHIEPWVEHG